LFLWKEKPAAVAAPPETPEDILAQADIALKEARDEYALACKAVSGWRVKHPEFTRIGEGIYRQFIPSPELRELSRRESQTHAAMCAAMERRASLIQRFKPESKFVAGSKVG
jgi:hypothetical protein